MVELAQLVTELKALRKGRGLFVSRIDERIGSAIRDVCELTEDDGPATIRQKITHRLEELAASMPADLRVTVLAAFAICPEARMPLYQERMKWAADHLNRDSRTARRRADDGIAQLAELAVLRRNAARRQPHAAEYGWHTAELQVMLALDRQRPEAVELRRIVADQDDLIELDLPVTLAAHGEHRPLEIDVYYGGTLIDRGMDTSSRRAFALRLHRPMARGETRDIALSFVLPEGRPMRPYFVCVPKHPCEIFYLHIRFDRTQMPSRIWQVRNAFERDIDDLVASGAPYPVDESCEAHFTFNDLTPGFAYGARWDPPSSNDGG
jgi:hypothetical protein